MSTSLSGRWRLRAKRAKEIGRNDARVIAEVGFQLLYHFAICGHSNTLRVPSVVPLLH